MAIKPVLRMGDPLLFAKAESVSEFDTPALHALIQDMQDTMESMDGAGIAAPQIGVSLRVVILVWALIRAIQMLSKYHIPY